MHTIDKNGKIRLSNSQSVENLVPEAAARVQTKTRLNVTVLPKTSNWLKQGGNASQRIDELVAAAIDGNLSPSEHLSQQLEEVNLENSELKAQLSQLQKELESPKDYQVIREKVLASLKLGRQAPGYKSASKALDRFITEVAHSS